jgi:hypothetical protein
MFYMLLKYVFVELSLIQFLSLSTVNEPDNVFLYVPSSHEKEE